MVYSWIIFLSSVLIDVLYLIHFLPMISLETWLACSSYNFWSVKSETVCGNIGWSFCLLWWSPDRSSVHNNIHNPDPALDLLCAYYCHFGKHKDDTQLQTHNHELGKTWLWSHKRAGETKKSPILYILKLILWFSSGPSLEFITPVQISVTQINLIFS